MTGWGGCRRTSTIPTGPFQEANQGAVRFWRRVATDVVGTARREELRPVPGKPDVQPDTGLLLAT